MSGIDPGFFIVANLVVLSALIMLIRAVFPQAFVFRTMMTLVGMYMLYLISPRFVLFFLGFWLIIWALQWFAARLDTIKADWLRRILTASTIMIPLLPLLLWKLMPEAFTLFINETFAKIFWTLFPGLGFADAIVPILAPIGLSFAVFRALDLIIKVRLGLLKPIDPGRVLYYGFFPPVLAVGPIIEYEEIRIEGRLPRLPLSGDIAVGITRILIGAVKVFFFAILLNHFAGLFWAKGQAGVLASWAGLLLFGIYFYINFSGYSDMAIGVSRLFGLKLKENFDNPFFKTNPSSFWNGWHMSLTRWVYRYVFTPLGGMRPNKQYFAIFMTIMAIALWHNITWPMVIFGTYHGLIMVGHRYFDNRRKKKKIKLSKNPAIKGLKMFGVFVFVSLSMPLFTLQLDQILPFYAKFIPGL